MCVCVCIIYIYIFTVYIYAYIYIYIYIYKSHASYARTDRTSFIFSQSTDSLTSFLFCITVQRQEWRHEGSKNLCYFIKQIENSFRVPAL